MTRLSAARMAAARPSGPSASITIRGRARRSHRPAPRHVPDLPARELPLQFTPALTVPHAVSLHGEQDAHPRALVSLPPARDAAPSASCHSARTTCPLPPLGYGAMRASGRPGQMPSASWPAGARSRAGAPARLPAGQRGRARIASPTPRADTDPPDTVPLTMWSNADPERLVLTARTEVTDPMLISGQRHLRTIPARHVAHHNGPRPHRSRPLPPTTLSPTSPGNGSKPAHPRRPHQPIRAGRIKVSPPPEQVGHKSRGCG